MPKILRSMSLQSFLLTHNSGREKGKIQIEFLSVPQSGDPFIQHAVCNDALVFHMKTSYFSTLKCSWAPPIVSPSSSCSFDVGFRHSEPTVTTSLSLVSLSIMLLQEVEQMLTNNPSFRLLSYSPRHLDF